MKGYKILESDYKTHAIPARWCVTQWEYERHAKQYSVPGTFEEKVYPRAGERGMHFSQKLLYAILMKGLDGDSVVVEVEAESDTDNLYSTFSTVDCRLFQLPVTTATNKLRIIREIKPDEAWEIILDELAEMRRNYSERFATNRSGGALRKVCGRYFHKVKNFTADYFIERTGLAESPWAEWLRKIQ